MVILGNTRHYPLLVSMEVAKQRLASIAAGEPMHGRDDINTFLGSISSTGTLAVLKDSSSGIKGTYIEVELRESEGEVWVRITLAPSKRALVIFAVLLAMSGTAYMLFIRPLGFALPLLLFSSYIHFISYADTRQDIGKLIDPLYFNSPAAMAVASEKLWSVATIANNASLWVGLISIIGVLLWAILSIL